MGKEAEKRQVRDKGEVQFQNRASSLLPACPASSSLFSNFARATRVGTHGRLQTQESQDLSLHISMSSGGRGHRGGGRSPDVAPLVRAHEVEWDGQHCPFSRNRPGAMLQVHAVGAAGAQVSRRLWRMAGHRARWWLGTAGHSRTVRSE